MSTELQGSEEPTIDISIDTTESNDPGLAPVEEAKTEPRKVEFDEHQQKVIDDLAAKKTRQIRDAERNNADLQAQLDAANARIPEETRANVPDLPDPYDDDFESKMAARDEAITSAASFDARTRHAEQAQENQRVAAERQRQHQLVDSVNVYTDRATAQGITGQELDVAGGVLAQAGMGEDLAMYIIADDKGPLITKHLAENPQLVEAMRTMTTTQAAVYIATEVKPNVSAKTRETAPNPADTLSGGAPQTGDGWPEGATFE